MRTPVSKFIPPFSNKILSKWTLIRLLAKGLPFGTKKSAHRSIFQALRILQIIEFSIIPPKVWRGKFALIITYNKRRGIVHLKMDREGRKISIFQLSPLGSSK